MLASELVEMAKDPALVPGVYNYCDHWCSYCAMTARCLVYRARVRWDEEPTSAPTLQDAVAFTRAVAKAAGRGTPELDAAMVGLPVRNGEHPNAVERLALRYAALAGRLLLDAGWRPLPETVLAAGQPAPLDVIGWYHLMIPAKVGRAFDSASPACGSPEARWPDALGSTKIALIGVERSRRALELLAEEGIARGIPEMLRLLGQLESRLVERFPDARAFVRPGLDCPVA